MKDKTTSAIFLRHNVGAKLRDALLDSSLILTTKNKSYDLKIVDCCDYIQVYSKQNKFFGNFETISKKNNSIQKIDTDNLVKFNNINSNNKIKFQNIIRSKLECQRLAKANSKYWNTFITLTFKDNITDIKLANKKFRNFIDSIKRVFNSFKYICIPEFQKRGSVHYHLLSNININSNLITIQYFKNKKYYHIKYWNNGFNKVDNISGDIKKIIGYISKYMTKNIDNRLFNKHRYFYSRNLTKPTTIYINLSNIKEKTYYLNLLSNKNLIYENNYISLYDRDTINFKEYL